MTRENNRIAQWILAIVIGLGIIIGFTWVNYSYSKENPGGSEFLVHYIGTRSFIYEGISPYSDEVAARIQTAAYGHIAEGEEHQLRVAYPFYSIILFSPFALIKDYALSRAIWMTLLELSLITMCFVSFRLSKWNPPLWLQAALLLFSITWYHALRGIINGNAVILIALGLSLVLYLLEQEKDNLAGMLLAFTTIKPHLIILIIPLILIWSIYHSRLRIIRSFIISLLGLVGAGLILLPSWITQNIIEILRYPGYNPAGTLAAALIEMLPGIRVGVKWVIWIALATIMIYEWWSGRAGEYNQLLWVAFLTIGISQWIGIQTDPGNFILLFPALIFILASLDKRWKPGGKIVTGVILGVLWIGLWILFLATIQHTYQPVQNPIMFIPLPAIILVGLYWIKWWVISPARFLWSDGL